MIERILASLLPPLGSLMSRPTLGPLLTLHPYPPRASGGFPVALAGILRGTLAVHGRHGRGRARHLETESHYQQKSCKRTAVHLDKHFWLRTEDNLWNVTKCRYL